LSGDVECLKWDPTTSHQFFVSTEHGIVQCYDIRNTQSQQPIFTLHAHDEAVTSFDIHPTISNCMVTCSTDKLIKIWDYKNNQPSMVLSRNFDLGQLFSVSFNKHQPTTLVMGGSKGEPTVWEFGSNQGVRRCFKDRKQEFNAEVKEKKVVSLADDNEDSENEAGPAFEGQEEDDDDMMDTS
jgi:periodic tryptophan protein 1